jgi:hypothetical protein
MVDERCFAVVDVGDDRHVSELHGGCRCLVAVTRCGKL